MEAQSEAPECPAIIEARALYKIFGPRPGEARRMADAGEIVLGGAGGEAMI